VSDSRSLAFTWASPTRIVFGPGVLDRLPALLEETVGPAARIFLVTGRQSLRASGVLDRVMATLDGDRVSLFDQVPPFPSPARLDSAVAAARAARPDAVVAIGGGSAMDVAKTVALLFTHDGPPREYVERRQPFTRPGLPVIAVPTTSGSSSEVTPFAAFWEMTARRSLHVATPLLFPRAALVDPELALGMSPALAAQTGFDAFTSAFESYWSVEATPLSDALNLEVVRSFAAHLERSCQRGDLDARAGCALAATLSGLAYSNSRPNACHAVSTPLTLFWGVAHGQAVAVTLPAFLRWTAPAIGSRLPALWRALGVDDLDDAVRRITAMMTACGLATRLQELGPGLADVETLVEHMRWERVAVLPRPLGREHARELLTALV
jgi:alcohol dehydrogenase class IV